MAKKLRNKRREFLQALLKDGRVGSEGPDTNLRTLVWHLRNAGFVVDSMPGGNAYQVSEETRVRMNEHRGLLRILEGTRGERALAKLTPKAELWLRRQRTATGLTEGELLAALVEKAAWA